MLRAALVSYTILTCYINTGIEWWHALITHLFLGARRVAERTFVLVKAVQLHRLL